MSESKRPKLESWLGLAAALISVSFAIRFAFQTASPSPENRVQPTSVCILHSTGIALQNGHAPVVEPSGIADGEDMYISIDATAGPDSETGFSSFLITFMLPNNAEPGFTYKLSPPHLSRSNAAPMQACDIAIVAYKYKACWCLPNDESTQAGTCGLVSISDTEVVVDLDISVVLRDPYKEGQSSKFAVAGRYTLPTAYRKSHLGGFVTSQEIELDKAGD